MGKKDAEMISTRARVTAIPSAPSRGIRFSIEGQKRKVHPGLPLGPVPGHRPGTIPRFLARRLRISASIGSQGTPDEPGLPDSRHNLDRFRTLVYRFILVPVARTLNRCYMGLR